MTEEVLRFGDFSSLSQKDRNKILTELVSQFKPSDWWKMDELFQQQSIYHHFDIVAALPLELSIQIFGYLALPELFLNRRVSRRWFDILNTQELCGTLARKFFPRESREFRLSQLDETHLSVGVPDWKHFWEDTASRKCFFSRGEYVTYPKLDSAVFGEYVNKWHQSPILYHNKTALQENLPGESNSEIVRVYYLDDPTKTTEFLVPNREHVTKFVLNDEILVGITAMGNCHAFRLEDGGRKSIRMESGYILELLVVDYTVAAIFPGTAIIWDTQTQNSWKIEISDVNRHIDVAYQLDPVRKTLWQLYPVIHADKSIMQQDQHAYDTGTGLKFRDFIHPDDIFGRHWKTIATSNPQNLKDYAYTEHTADSGLVGKIVWIIGDGPSMPRLFYCNTTKRWRLEKYSTVPKEFSPQLSHLKTVKFNDNAAFFWVKTRHNPSYFEIVGVYLLKESKWANWSQDSWGGEYLVKIPISDRYFILGNPVDGNNKIEVRRFVGIHQRKVLEKWI